MKYQVVTEEKDPSMTVPDSATSLVGTFWWDGQLAVHMVAAVGSHLRLIHMKTARSVPFVAPDGVGKYLQTKVRDSGWRRVEVKDGEAVRFELYRGIPSEEKAPLGINYRNRS